MLIASRLKQAVAAVALVGALAPAVAGAQVQQVELDIAGYLCGF